MPTVHYSPLHQYAENLDEPLKRRERPIGRLRASAQWLRAVLAISFVLNIVQFSALYQQSMSLPDGDGLRDIAGLEWNVSETFPLGAPWNSDNRTEEDEVWNQDYFQPSMSIVAVSRSWAQDKGIHPAQSWPWDESKGIYFINAMHSLHCVKNLRESFMDFYDGNPQRLSAFHVKHCLNVLRSEIMCRADDTLRFTGAPDNDPHATHAHSGMNQQRTCRDWSHLVDWARENSACYQPIDATGDEFMEEDRYKFCPDGSKHWD